MEKIFIKNRKDQKIAVVVNIPENPKGLAFVMHGLGGYKEQVQIQAMSTVFYKYSLTTVLFDTTNSIGESDGKFEMATMQNYYEDLEDVIFWSKTQVWYQVPFFLAGHSLGGYSVVQFSENYPELVKGIFALAPVVSGKLSMDARKKSDPEGLKKWEETGWEERPSTSRPEAEKPLPWSHMEERLKHDLLPNSSKLTMPIFIIVGDKDNTCPADQQKILYDKISGTKELVVTSGAGHSFKEPAQLEILTSNLSKWIEGFN